MEQIFRMRSTDLVDVQDVIDTRTCNNQPPLIPKVEKCIRSMLEKTIAKALAANSELQESKKAKPECKHTIRLLS
jgi:hypothetical protein